MAFLDATLWNDLQVTTATNEKRFSQLGIVDSIKDSTPFVDYVSPSDRQKLAEFSSIRDLQIPVIKDQTVTVNTTPGFDFIPSNLPETDQYSFTAFDVFSGFRHYPAAYGNNSIDSDFAREQVMMNVAFAMGNSIETILAARLEDRKTQLLNFTTQVSQGDGTYTFNGGTDVLEINKAAQKETMFFNLEALMAANELGGNYRIMTNRAGLSVQKAEQLKFSVANSENKNALGMFPLDRMYESGNISAGSDNFQGWLMRDGAMGVYENFPFDFRDGTEFAGKQWSVSDVEIPFTRMRANIYTNTEATEATSLVAGAPSDMKMTHFEEMAIWTRFYVVFRFNSDLTTRANDVVKITGEVT